MAYIIFILFVYNFHVLKRSENISFVFLLFSLVLFSGTRLVTGWDWWEYELFFDSLPTFNEAFLTYNNDFFNHFFEPGFKFYTLILKSIFNNFEIFLFFSSLISISLVGISIKRIAPYPFESLLLYVVIIYLYVEFSVVRQSISIGFFIFSLKYIKEQCFYKYFMCCIVSGLFHVSGFLLLFLYFILNKNFNKKFYLTFILLGFFAFNLNFISLVLSPLIPHLGPISWKLLEYIQSNAREMSLGVVETFVITIVFVLLNSKIKLMVNGYGKIFLNMQLVSFFLVFYCHEVFIMADRFKFYFLFSIVFIFPELLRMCKLQNKRIFVSLSLVVLSIHFSLKPFKTESNQIVYFPYHSFLLNSDDEISQLKINKMRAINDIIE
ncbi:EpsG family protein [Shewanella sp. DW31]|uniref:EpsG family protein n=1 Tax=Shewanella sp. DW31 TaxID=2699422 RepID=UPI0018E2F311|nr:EpsG family protein [Shewanella sp. DW31]MBI1674393.1 EpsG family protein [Shewanella sp. DW31]